MSKIIKYYQKTEFNENVLARGRKAKFKCLTLFDINLSLTARIHNYIQYPIIIKK